MNPCILVEHGHDPGEISELIETLFEKFLDIFGEQWRAYIAADIYAPRIDPPRPPLRLFASSKKVDGAKAKAKMKNLLRICFVKDKEMNGTRDDILKELNYKICYSHRFRDILTLLDLAKKLETLYIMDFRSLRSI